LRERGKIFEGCWRWQWVVSLGMMLILRGKMFRKENEEEKEASVLIFD
jgi:hypothetical protein